MKSVITLSWFVLIACCVQGSVLANVDIDRLINAASRNDTTEVKRLIAIVGVNATNKYGKTALMSAASNGYKKTVKVLLDNQADRNIKVPDSIPNVKPSQIRWKGKTASQIAKMRNFKRLAKCIDGHPNSESHCF